MGDTQNTGLYKSRKCSRCAEGTLQCIEVKNAGVGVEVSYKCLGCALETTIPAVGFIGTYLIVWAAVSSGLFWLFLAPSNYPGWLSYLLVGGLILGGGFIGFRDLQKHLVHPFVQADDPGPNAAIHSPMLLEKFWGMGLFKTPTLTLLAFAVLLGGAAVLGFFLDHL